MTRRVVITGMGTINPIGHGVEQTWSNAIAGVSGIGPITRFDCSDLKVRHACEVKGFDPEEHLGAKETRRRDRFEHFAAVAAAEALASSGLELDEATAQRAGVVFSSSGGGMGTVEEMFAILQEKGPGAVSPFTSPMFMASGAAGLTSIDFGLKGPSLAVTSACASASDGLGVAWLLIRAGMADVMVAGGSDASLVRMCVAALDRSGAMSRREGPNPQTPQPFDLDRDGFVIGEGAAVLVLESEEHARSRGAEIQAELAGYGASADAYHITAPLEDGGGAARAMRLAIEAGGLDPSEIDHVNSHGTGTRLNDVSETRAIKMVFSERAHHIPVCATKSMTGHIMGSTPALEAIFTVLSLREGVIPPTINYVTPDPECDLDYVPNQARQVAIEAAISNAFGFGGHNSALVFKRYH